MRSSLEQSTRTRPRGLTGAHVGAPTRSSTGRHQEFAYSELQRGLDHHEFVLHYQPVVDLEGEVVTGVEALVRWNHPTGLRMPDTFIPLAEASGLIVPIGAWVLAEACHQAARWDAQGLHLDMAVNLSAHQLAAQDIAGAISHALTQAVLEPTRLLVEVTESAVFENSDAARMTLDSIRALGCRVAIDDFGTGYGSLLYLKQYPVNALKVDRSFVAGLTADPADDAIVASVVTLARAVGALSIAEGVETSAQWSALRSLGCDYAQGYLFARPVSAPLVPAACAAALVTLTSPGTGRRTRRSLPLASGAVLARISKLQKTGASLHTIACALNRERLLNPHGVRWHQATVGQAASGCGIRRPHPGVRVS
jgi:EAL domain-containing protein (putative c-di-GMP-specific phosphodiesterase class I)